MRRLFPLIGGFGLIVGACVAAAALGRSNPAPVPPPAAHRLDPARPADRRLIAYGEAHPDCPLWTNWDKLCSRTGPGGRVRCNADPDRRVRPSTPFCAAGFAGSPENRHGAELASAERFCVAYTTLHSRSMRGEQSSTRICARYAPERPFDGRRIASLTHPWCESWSDQVTNEPVCTLHGDHARGLPACGALSGRHYRSVHPLTCDSWAAPARACRHPEPARPSEPTGADVAVGGIRVPDTAPVVGVLCDE